MIKSITALLVAIVVGAAMAPAPARAQDGVITFTFTNNTSYRVYVKMFSQARPWTWPSPTESWALNDNAPHSMRLSCIVGEKICYGGFWTDGHYWGVGRDGKQSCDDCCLTCGTFEENRGANWNLVD
jgi:hypothetical protein